MARINGNAGRVVRLRERGRVSREELEQAATVLVRIAARVLEAEGALGAIDAEWVDRHIHLEPEQTRNHHR